MQKLQFTLAHLQHGFSNLQSYLNNLCSCGNGCSGGVATHTAFFADTNDELYND